MRLPFIYLLLAALCACSTTRPPEQVVSTEPSVAPEPQQAIVPTAWKHGAGIEALADTAWWKALNDDTVDMLVSQALLSNPDIHIAEARLGQVEATAAEADPDEQSVAQAALRASTNDVRVLRQGIVHAIVTTYLEARLTEQRKEILRQRMQLTRQLTQTVHKRVAAGINHAGLLRDQEQAELDAHQAISRLHLEHAQAVTRLATLLGTAPIEFSLPAGSYPTRALPEIAVDTPASLMEHRADVQAAWQRLQAANALPADDDDSSPILMQIEQADQVVSVREAMYQKAVHTALQDVESAMGAWHSAGTEQKMAEDALELRTADVRDTQRAMAAGRASRVELLKAELNENQARENLLVTTHARYLAFAAVQLALGRE